MRKNFLAIALLLMFWATKIAYAAHPLITDDTGTNGQYGFLLEINSEFNNEMNEEDEVTEKITGGELAAAFSFGATERLDIVLGLPYQWQKISGEETTSTTGLADVSLEVKWRFFEQDKLSFALKPGIAIPIGNMSAGKPSYGLTLITTKDLSPWVFHLNLAVEHSEIIPAEENEETGEDAWHTSLAVEKPAAEKVTLVANMGIEGIINEKPEVFILGGLIYSLTENLNLDAGFKAWANEPETKLEMVNTVILIGSAYSF